MALYEEIKSRNIIAVIKHLLREGVLELRHSDGKAVPCNLKNTWHTPWLFHRSSYRHNCYIWKDIVFENIVMTVLPREKWIVPSMCQDCFKVVVKPKTLEQLMKLAKLQYAMDHASKCGIELRPSVFGNYGGYFYNRGLDEGLECYRKVKKAVNELIGDIPVMLKRGCTEMEHNVGPSDQWEVSPEQLEFEKLLESRLAMDVPVLPQAPHMKDHVKQLWIEKAWEWGDDTVFKYIDVPLYPGYVTYHDMEETNDTDSISN